MVKLCLMACHGYNPALVLHQDQAMTRVITVIDYSYYSVLDWFLILFKLVLR